ncbi:MAG: 16S rRNA (guanine(527)-N(7))-methyltransferase RsmG [Eubacteriales bacterium]|nr:16S rRNA (guanine(527)-N(7))-methyltransferase RsmG [Eubacteriales bacterium]
MTKSLNAEALAEAHALIASELASLDAALVSDDRLTNAEIQQIHKYQEHLLQRNLTLNLTRITEAEEIRIKQIEDCLSLQTWIDRLFKYHEKFSFLDLGTGAGLPGILLKILYPESKACLLDSLRKRIDFLSEVVELLELRGVDLRHARAEELGRDPAYRSGFDLVIARAVAPLNILLEYSLPFVKPAAYFIAMKTDPAEVELARHAAQSLGAKLLDVSNFELSDSSKRSLFVYQKIGACPKIYPRTAAQIKRRPL